MFFPGYLFILGSPMGKVHTTPTVTISIGFISKILIGET